MKGTHVSRNKQRRIMHGRFKDYSILSVSELLRLSKLGDKVALAYLKIVCS